MKHWIRQALRDAALAFLVVIAFLVIQGQLDRKQAVKQVTDAYKRGVSVGIMAGRYAPLTPAMQSQLVEICNQSWPDTTDGAEARRRACGTLPASKRSDQ